jgi:hypothetical protein
MQCPKLIFGTSNKLVILLLLQVFDELRRAPHLSNLAGVANNFPPNLWDQLLPQTKIMINLIQQSYATPNVLAHAHLSGPFDYNRMPLAPMGCEA